MSELPEGWADTTIEDVTSFVSRGRSPKYAERSDLPVINQRCIRWTGIQEEHLKFVDPLTWDAWDESRYAQVGDILWNSTGTGTIGRAALFAGLKSHARAVVDSHVTIVRPNPAIEPRFLFALIRSPAVQSVIEDMQSGSTNQVELGRGAVLSTRVPLPPLAEQRRIVAKLDQVMARTARARAELARIPALIAQHKRAFLAVEIEAASAGANESTLEEILDVLTSGSRDWAQYYDRGTGVFVLAGNVKPMAFDPNPRRFVDPPRDGPDAKRSRVAQDDILLTIVGAGTGELCRVAEAVEDYFVCQSIALLRPKEAHLSQWLELYLNSEMHGKGQIQELIYGQGRPHLGFDDIKGIVVRVPSRAAIASAVRRIESAFAWLDKVAHEHAQATRLLDHLDQALLAKAFRGELVPQDPADEPAAKLLARIRAERETAAPAARKRKARA